MHTCTRARAHTCTRAHVHTHTCMYAHMHTHTHTDITRTRTRTRIHNMRSMLHASCILRVMHMLRMMRTRRMIVYGACYDYDAWYRYGSFCMFGWNTREIGNCEKSDPTSPSNKERHSARTQIRAGTSRSSINVRVVHVINQKDAARERWGRVRRIRRRQTNGSFTPCPRSSCAPAPGI